METNVLGTELQSCCTSPMTGFFRTGVCLTGPNDHGSHVVCAQITDQFLKFTKSKGNDLSTPHLSHGFPGLKVGDKWCLCVTRWNEAAQAGFGPPVYLSSTHRAALNIVTLEELKKHAVTEPHSQKKEV